MNKWHEYGLCLVILLGVYATSLVVAFAHHDQYRFFREDYGDPTFKEHCYNDSENGSIRTLGRPLGAKLECTIFFHTFRIRHLTYFRFVCVLGFALAAMILSLWLQGLGVSIWGARLFALGLVTLPGAQNAVFISNMPNTITPLAALAAGVLALRPWNWKFHLGAWVLIGIAFFTYTPIVLIFFVPLIISFLVDLRSREALWHVSARASTVFLGAAAVWWQFGRKKFASNPAAMPVAYQMTLSPSLIGENLPRFFKEILPTELHAWDVYGELFGPFLLALGLLVLFMPSSRRRGAAALAVLAFFGANVLYLCTKAYVLYRVMWPGMMMAVTLAFAPALVSTKSWIRKVAIGGLLAGLALTFFNNHRNVMNSRAEIDFILAALQKAPKDIKAIHIIAPSGRRGLNGMPFKSSDEYNWPSTAFLPGFFVDVIRAGYIELDQTRVVVPRDLPSRIDEFHEVELKPTASADEYDVIFNDQVVGQIREGQRLKLVPWEARGEVAADRQTLDLWRLGQWHRLSPANGSSLAGKWRLEGLAPIIYVSAATADVPPPANAFVIDINAQVPPSAD